jgi:hypothetical protein
MISSLSYLSKLFKVQAKAVASLGLALCTLAGCSNGASACDSGACDAVADAQRPPSRCYTAQLPSCARGADLYSDEACFAWEDFELRTPPELNAMRAPTLILPANMAVLPAQPPALFRWMGNLSRSLNASTRAVAFATHSHRAQLPTRGVLTWRDELQKFFTLLPEAHAHCAPFSGIAYGLDFYSGSSRVLRLEQSSTEVTLDAQSWTALRAVAGPIDVKISVARMRANELTEGPYLSPVTTRFTIAAQ